MKQIIISLETPDIKALEKVGDKAVIIKVKLYLIFIHLLSDLFVNDGINRLRNQVNRKIFFLKWQEFNAVTFRMK